jgi:nucleoside-diphosphate-sugar epimerase
MQGNGEKKVLVTGAAGRIGQVLVNRLGDRYEFSSLDLVEAKNVPSTVADIRNLEAIVTAFYGQDAVVHLAADPHPNASWESALSNNIIGTYNVFEASRLAGIRRVVAASSNHVMGGHYLDSPWKHVIDDKSDKLESGYPLVTELMPIRPDSYYGISKATGESLGSYYWDHHGISSVHLRIGWVLADDDPTISAYAQSLWLSHRDVAQLVRLGLDAPASLGYAVVNATSDNKRKIFSLDRAREALGFKPADGAEKKFQD